MDHIKMGYRTLNIDINVIFHRKEFEEVIEIIRILYQKTDIENV